MLYHFTVMIKEWNHIEWDVLNRITCSWRHDIGNTVQFSPIHIWAFIRQMNVSRIHISIDIISIFPIQYVNIYSTFLPREALSHDYIVILILYNYKAWVGNHLYIYIYSIFFKSTDYHFTKSPYTTNVKYNFHSRAFCGNLLT
jgi:hypothetical protein